MEHTRGKCTWKSLAALQDQVLNNGSFLTIFKYLRSGLFRDGFVKSQLSTLETRRVQNWPGDSYSALKTTCFQAYSSNLSSTSSYVKVGLLTTHSVICWSILAKKVFFMAACVSLAQANALEGSYYRIRHLSQSPVFKEQTPSTSTFLLCWLVGRFTSVKVTIYKISVYADWRPYCGVSRAS